MNTRRQLEWQLYDLTIPQLRVILQQRSLAIRGHKFEMVARLLDDGLEVVPEFPKIATPSKPRPIPQPYNLDLHFVMGQVYVGREVYMLYHIFLRLIGATKTGNPKFEILETIKGPLTLDRSRRIVYPNLGTERSSMVVGRTNKTEGWCVTVGVHKYCLDAEPFDPNYTYTDTILDSR